MNKYELYHIIALSIIIIIAPMFPNSLLMSFDSLIVRILTVLFALYVVSIGPIAGIFGFITISVLFLERNKLKVRRAAKKLDEIDTTMSNEMTVEESGISQKNVDVVEFDKPEYNELSYIPKYDSGNNDFNPVDVTINNKQILPTIYSSGKADKSRFFENQGFASEIN
jgi:hypothetical protein